MSVQEQQSPASVVRCHECSRVWIHRKTSLESIVWKRRGASDESNIRDAVNKLLNLTDSARQQRQSSSTPAWERAAYRYLPFAAHPSGEEAAVYEQYLELPPGEVASATFIVPSEKSAFIFVDFVAENDSGHEITIQGHEPEHQILDFEHPHLEFHRCETTIVRRVFVRNLSKTETIWAGGIHLLIETPDQFGQTAIPRSVPALEDIIELELEGEIKKTVEDQSFDDLLRLTSLQDMFADERIFIVGNGPSLNELNLEKLDSEWIFGTNRISLLFDRVSWRPQFYTAFDTTVVPDNQIEFSAVPAQFKFFSSRYKGILKDTNNSTYWYHASGKYRGFGECFVGNPSHIGFGGGGTISVIAIQLAAFLGFREIILIGTDLNYTVNKSVRQSGHLYKDGISKDLLSVEDDDSSHFDPRYFGRGKKWHNPNAQAMAAGFGACRNILKQRNIRLVNATPGGNLNTIERVSFDSLFGKSRSTW